MKEYFKTSLLYMVNFTASWFIGVLIHSFTLQLVINIAMSPGTIRNLINKLSLIIVVSIFLYITMSKTGYKRNVIYEQKTIKNLLIPIIISIILFVIIVTANNIFVYNHKKTDFDLVDGLISTYINLIPYPFIMFLGIIRGYKKREKERQKLMSKK